MSGALEKASQYEKRIKFIQHLGIKTIALDDGHARVEMELKLNSPTVSALRTAA